MNIIITLPSTLANLIYEGKKTIEVRKCWPKDFDINKDVVYICEKRTVYVTGMFTIEALTATKKPHQVWNQHHEAICIDKQWWNRYTENANEIFLWHIRNAEHFHVKYPLQLYFGVYRAPQSYVYTDTQWYFDEHLLIQVESRPMKAVQ